METQSGNALARWTTAECPFAIDYSARVLDDIRLAVTDAFFSLPRGGAEIGGLLLGRQEKDRIAILDSRPMECEHAFGPSFVLSPRDHARLGELVAAADRNTDYKIVGWYHSHTRSEIFLSDEDLEIHKRFFPQPWQVALVLKPHTFQPMRAGFFFREKSGSIHAAAPHNEIVLEPMPMRPVTASNGAPDTSGLFRPLSGSDSNGPVIDIAGVVETGPTSAESEPQARPVVLPPSFLAQPPPPSRRWMAWVAAVVLGTALGAWAYHTRAEWLPRIQSISRAAPQEKIGLISADREGQLQIFWNGGSRAALTSTSGQILIVDGDRPLTVELGRPHVLTGSFTYARRTERVYVTLVLPQPDGKEVREMTVFAGDPPGGAVPPSPVPPPAASAPPANVPSDAPSANADALTAEIARLKRDNAIQVERNKRLEKALEELRKVMQRDDQRKRLELQSRDAAK